MKEYKLYVEVYRNGRREKLGIHCVNRYEGDKEAIKGLGEEAALLLEEAGMKVIYRVLRDNTVIKKQSIEYSDSEGLPLVWSDDY